MSTQNVWKSDPTHSSVEFSVRHLMISTVKGRFNQFEITLEGDPENLPGAKVNVSIDVASIDTMTADRDNHLRSADFFDVENHPKITFASTSIKSVGGNEYEVTGDLTIRGVTRPVTLKVVYEGSGKDPWGGERAAFSVSGRLNRKDFGLTWNTVLETGGVLVGEEVKVELQVELIQQAA